MINNDFVITPLQAYAYQAHELFTSFIEAGFNEPEAWELLIRNLPEWQFPEQLESMNLEELEEEADESEE